MECKHYWINGDRVLPSNWLAYYVQVCQKCGIIRIKPKFLTGRAFND